MTYDARAAVAQNPMAKACLELMARKKTNLSVAADVDTVEEMLEIADKVIWPCDLAGDLGWLGAARGVFVF